jgi:hypothetical protein
MGEFEGKSEINVRPEQNRSRPNGGRYLTYMLHYLIFLHAEGQKEGGVWVALVADRDGNFFFFLVGILFIQS